MEKLLEKAKKIKLMIFDVDGVLTDGKLFYNNDGVAFKSFHIQDGQGIKFLIEQGIEVAIITLHDSPIILRRMEQLGVKHVFFGNQSKLATFEKLIEKLHLSPEQVGYLGDDIPDLPVIRRVGLGLVVANAASQIIPYADGQTKAKGGCGAAREVCDLLLKAQNLESKVLEPYL